MFVTRATRHDRADIEELLAAEQWMDDVDLSEGTAFIARDGRVAGVARLVEVAPGEVVVDDVVVRSGVRRSGVGTALMQAAMNSRGGRLFVCCHDHVIPFYERFGFSAVDFESLPEAVRAYYRRAGDHPTEPGHVHYFLTAR